MNIPVTNPPGAAPGGLHEDLGILPDLAPRVEARDRSLAIRTRTAGLADMWTGSINGGTRVPKMDGLHGKILLTWMI